MRPRLPGASGRPRRFTGWAPDEAIRNRILVDNPAALYRFAKTD